MLNHLEQGYVASTRPALLLANPNNITDRAMGRLVWHAFVNIGQIGRSYIGHLWGAPPTSAGSCEQEIWGTAPPPASGSPAAMLDPRGNAHVFFVHQANKRIYQIVKLANQDDWGYAGFFWSSSDVDGLPEASGDPAALCTPDGTQHVFYRTTANQIHHIWWDPALPPIGTLGKFSHAPWGETVPNAQGAPAALQDPDGVIHVYYRCADGNIYQTVGRASRDQDGTTYRDFRNYHFFPGSGSGDAVGDPSAVVTSSGRQCVFYRDHDNNVMMQCWSKANEWESGQVLPEGLTLAGDPCATLLGGESALVLARASLADGEELSVAFPCSMDASVVGDIMSGWWNPWYNLPLPHDQTVQPGKAPVKYRRLVKKLSQHDMRTVLQTYSPRIWLYSLEVYKPSSVDFAFAHMKRFLSSEYKYRDRPAYCIETRESFYWPVYPSFFAGEDYQRDNNDKPTCVAACYAFLVDKVGPFTDLTYFFFYPFNFGTGGSGTWGNHVGDWEYVTVRVMWNPTPTGWGSPRPWAVYTSAHSGGSRRLWDHVETSGGTHPVIYAAGGTHANYFESGTHVHDGVVLDFCNQGTAWNTKDHLTPFYWHPDNPDPENQGDFQLTALNAGQQVPEWMKSNCYEKRGTGPGAPGVPTSGPIFRWGNEADWWLKRTGDSPQGPLEKWEVWQAWSLG